MREREGYPGRGGGRERGERGSVKEQDGDSLVRRERIDVSMYYQGICKPLILLSIHPFVRA